MPTQGSHGTCRWTVAWTVVCLRDTRRADGLPLIGEIAVIGLDWDWGTAVNLSIEVVG